MAHYELEQALPTQGNYYVAPLCTGDPDELLPVLSNLPGQKVAKVKVGLYEPIRDGMLVNLFLESMPDLTCVWMQPRVDSSQSAQVRSIRCAVFA